MKGYSNNRVGGRRYCPGCKGIFPRTKAYFYRFHGEKGWQSLCIKCQRESNKQPRRAQAMKLRLQALARSPLAETQKRAWCLKTRYGINLETYERLLREQDGKCSICRGVNPSAKRLSVDHDPLSGVVRGLLCFSCNMAIGYLKHSPLLLRRALLYLRDNANILPKKGLS